MVGGRWFVVLLTALAIGLAPLPQLVAAIGLALAVALPLVSPVFGIYLAVLSVPLQELITLPGGLSATQAAVLLMAAGWAAHGGAWGVGRGTRGAVPAGATPAGAIRPAARRSLLAPWLFLLWALLLSASLTPFSRTEAVKETARWGVAFLVWLVAATSLHRRWHAYGLFACLLVAPAATALVGLAQFATGDGPPTFRIAPGMSFVRAYGTIGQPNSFAGYMNMAWPLALGAAAGMTRHALRRRTADNRRSAVAWGLWSVVGGLWAVTALLLAALAASFSRGAWIGAAAGALGMVAVLLVCWATGNRPPITDHGPPTTRRRRLIGGGGLLVIIVGMAGIVSFAGWLPQPVAARLTSISRSIAIFDAADVEVTPENFAVVERMAHLQAGWRMLRERPIVGVGPGNFGVVYPRVAVGEWYASRGHAHNVYLHIAAEAGALGLAAYLALLGSVAWRAVVLARRGPDLAARAIAVGCCGMIAAVAGHNLFENLHVLNMGIQLAAAWALLTCAGVWEPQAPA